MAAGSISHDGHTIRNGTDDTSPFFPTTVDSVSSLECCLGAVQQWMKENGLKLNLGKTKVLWVGAPDFSGLGNSLSFFGGGESDSYHQE